MEKLIHSDSVKTALSTLGWSQKRLAAEIGVTAQAVTNWLQGADFPRPDKLLKLATTLKLDFDKLVLLKSNPPVVAFRKKGGAKTTEVHLIKAASMGMMLKPLVSYLPPLRALRTQIPSPSLDYNVLQMAAAAVRERVGIGAHAVLKYEHLINEFISNDAVIIPVMWGRQEKHGNALHILLPDENVTFIYLNLDTYFEDFKFWMAHELAHVYTPELAGTDKGEDFADSFAGALLFPKELAQAAYAEAAHVGSASKQIEILRKYAHGHNISLYSVYREVCNFAEATGLPHLAVCELDIHKVRNMVRGPLVSAALFDPMPPEASTYIAASNSGFKTSFFSALQRLLRERETGPGYVQQLLDISLKDATALYTELVS